MRLYYYKPEINPAADLTSYIVDKDSLHAIFINLVDGIKTADEIAKLLLVAGHKISDIVTVMNELQKEGVISESSTSDLGVFEPEELNNLERQIHALSKFSFDKKGMFMPFSPSAISHQKRIKDGKIMIVGNGTNACQLLLELSKLGIGSIHYYIHGADDILAQEEKVVEAWEDARNPYTNVFIYKVISEELDEEIITNADVDLIIYMADNFAASTSIKINDICRKKQVDFLPYQVAFPKVYIGPFYVYQQSACYKCYQIRKSAAAFNNEAQSISPGNTNLNIAFGIDLICLEIVKYYSYIIDLTTVNNVWVLDIFSGKTSLEPVFKLPRCPICGVSKIKPTKKLWENI